VIISLFFRNLKIKFFVAVRFKPLPSPPDPILHLTAGGAFL
jgi:hypothetical protein